MGLNELNKKIITIDAKNIIDIYGNDSVQSCKKIREEISKENTVLIKKCFNEIGNLENKIAREKRKVENAMNVVDSAQKYKVNVLFGRKEAIKKLQDATLVISKQIKIQKNIDLDITNKIDRNFIKNTEELKRVDDKILNFDRKHEEDIKSQEKVNKDIKENIDKLEQKILERSKEIEKQKKEIIILKEELEEIIDNKSTKLMIKGILIVALVAIVISVIAIIMIIK